MRSRLTEYLDAIDTLDLDPGLAAAALWLAQYIDEPDPETGDPLADTVTPECDGEPQRPAPTDPLGALVPRNLPTASVSAISQGMLEPPEVAVPVPAPLHDSARLRDEFRALSRLLPSTWLREFDEEASVERSAHFGIAWPVARSALVRQRDAVLVFDRHPSMAAWSGLADAVRGIAESVGFRRVESWYMDEDEDGGLHLAADPRGPADRPLSALRDPSGRRLVFVFSACLGDAWGWGTAARELADLAVGSPVTIMQPLPNSMWGRTGLEWHRGRITPMYPEGPSPLRVVGGADGQVLPIPVLQLSLGWIAPWAQLVAGLRPSAGYPLLRRTTVADSRTTRACRQDLELGTRPLDRVRGFRAGSSPAAFRLAASLAQTPLLLPIMRLVQRVMLPGSKPSVLAEVLAGGLIVNADDSVLAPYAVPEERRVFAFRPGVGEVLREAMPRSEANRVMGEVSRFVQEHYDVPAWVFPATLSEPADGAGAAFAYLSPEILRRIAPNFPQPPTEPPTVEDERRYDEIASAACAAAVTEDPESALRGVRQALTAVPVGSPARFGLLVLLTGLTRDRWLATDLLADLDEAIAIAKLALRELPASHENSYDVTADLGDMLLQRYAAGGGVDFLIEGVRVLNGVLEAMPAEDPNRARRAERLGDAYLWRCEAASEPLHGWRAVELFAVAITAGTSDREFVLLLKSTLAYLEIVEVSAYPEDDIVDQIVGEFDYAADHLGSGPTVEGAALLGEVVDRVVRMAASDMLPRPTAARMAQRVAAASGALEIPALALAYRRLAEVESAPGGESTD